MRSLDRIGQVFWKEVTDNLRDRRSVFSALMSALIGPIMLLILIIIIGKTVFQDQTENFLELPVSGAENAPALAQFLEQNGVILQPSPEDVEGEVRAGNLEAVLIISDSYAEDFRAGVPATVRLVIDSSRQSALAKVERVNQLLEAFNAQIGTLRLVARGISPVVISPLAIERQDVATPQSQALIFLNIMPYFIVMVVFVGGMYVVIDTTAGERERGSLEPLLINPVARWEFVVGKLAASLPFTVFAVLLTLAAFAVSFNAFPIEEYIGIQIRIDLYALAGIFLISLPMVLLAGSMQMIIATFTRSFKEAQTYVGFLPLIPALPGIGLAFLPVKASLWNMVIPTFGQQLLINQLMRGEAIRAENVLVSTAATCLLTLVFIFIAIKLYGQERVLFGAR